VIDHGDHVHEAREQVEQAAVAKEGDTGGRERLGMALLRVLLAKDVFSADELREEMESLDAKGVKGDGARLVARAWVDPDFKVSNHSSIGG
jgi:nitrile hydratase